MRIIINVLRSTGFQIFMLNYIPSFNDDSGKRKVLIRIIMTDSFNDLAKSRTKPRSLVTPHIIWPNQPTNFPFAIQRFPFQSKLFPTHYGFEFKD